MQDVLRPHLNVRTDSARFYMERDQTDDSHPCLTISVPEAGRRFLGLSRGSSYAAAARQEIPTVRIGRLLRVPVKAMERMLDVGRVDASGGGV